MFELPLSIFIIIYALFVLMTFVFALINIYHIVAGGTLNLLSFSVTAVVILLMVGVLASTGVYLSGIDLSQTTILFGAPAIPTL